MSDIDIIPPEQRFARIVLDEDSPGRRMLFVGTQFVDDDNGQINTFGEPSPFESMVERINAEFYAHVATVVEMAVAAALESERNGRESS